MKHRDTNRLDTRAGVAVYSRWALRVYDWWVLGFSNRYAWRCDTRTVLLPFYRRQLNGKHLDVGVGSGYYPANTPLPASQSICLLDLNANSLELAATRIAHLKPLTIQADVMSPLDALGERRFDSISLFYLLHCLPGDMSDKAVVFRTLRRHLSADGTLYGATILGDEVGHNWLGRLLMRIYNHYGVFSNRQDTQAGLEAALNASFEWVCVCRHGRVALFAAGSPRSANSG